MKKIGVITLSNSTNYGGLLQAAALNIALKREGYQPVYIQHQRMVNAWNSPVQYVKTRVRKYGSKGMVTKLRIIAGFFKTLFSNVNIIDRKKKIASFRAFIEENLVTTPYYGTMAELEKNCSDFGLYITGSDQVWNNAFTKNEFDLAYFLKFANKDAKRFSYAASVGGKKSDKYIAELVSLTHDFSAVSVREQSLEKHMRLAGAKDVITVLDPTLLLDKETWIGLEKAPNRLLPDRYILVYYLEKDASNDDIIKTVAKELGLPVININPNRKKTSYKSIDDYISGPAEFIYYFHNAEYVITNSFHAVVFSLIFSKKFLATSREGQESRIEDILKTVKMEERLIKENAEWKVINNPIFDITELIRTQKEVSLNFLKNME